MELLEHLVRQVLLVPQELLELMEQVEPQVLLELQEHLGLLV